MTHDFSETSFKQIYNPVASHGVGYKVKFTWPTKKASKFNTVPARRTRPHRRRRGGVHTHRDCGTATVRESAPKGVGKVAGFPSRDYWLLTDHFVPRYRGTEPIGRRATQTRKAWPPIGLSAIQLTGRAEPTLRQPFPFSPWQASASNGCPPSVPSTPPIWSLTHAHGEPFPTHEHQARGSPSSRTRDTRTASGAVFGDRTFRMTGASTRNGTVEVTWDCCAAEPSTHTLRYSRDSSAFGGFSEEDNFRVRASPLISSANSFAARSRTHARVLFYFGLSRVGLFKDWWFVWWCQSKGDWPCTSYRCTIAVWCNRVSSWTPIPSTILVPSTRATVSTHFGTVLRYCSSSIALRGKAACLWWSFFRVRLFWRANF